MTTYTAALIGPEAIARKPQILEALSTRDQWNLVEWNVDQTAEALTAALENADAVVMYFDASQDATLRAGLPRAPKLKLVHFGGTGTEGLGTDLLPQGAALCNTYGHEVAIAEYVLWGMLEADTHLSEINGRFKKLDWADRYGRPTAVPRPELFGKRLGLVGYGKIAQEVAKRAHAFGMHIAAVASRARQAPAPLDWLGGPEDLDRLCAESDHLVLATSLNPTTENLFDARRLKCMKPDAVLHNVGRAGVTNERDLFTALKDKTIRGAVLDVWWVYPSRINPAEDPGELAPSAFPFHELDNVIMTPHCSAATQGTPHRRYVEIAQNLDRLARNEPFANVVIVKS